MQTFSDKFMQLRQEALAVITELQKWHKNDFRIMEPVNKSGGRGPDDDFKKKSVELVIDHPGYPNNVDNVWPFAISRQRVYYISIDGFKSVVDVVELSHESLAALADWILANHPIQKPGEDKV